MLSDVATLPRMRWFVAAIFALAANLAIAQSYPSKPIRLIVPYAPGGTIDILCRRVADELSKRWGQPVVLDNRGGGGTIIGTEAAAKAPGDGYTMVVVANTFATNPALVKQLPYDTLRDFTPVSYLAVTPHVLVVPPSSPAKTLAEFVRHAKAESGKLNYGSIGNGSSTHLGVEIFKQRAGFGAQHVPYKGLAPALTDVVGGQTNFMLANVPNAAPLVKDGRLRAIAMAHPQRIATMPDVPTFSELGYAGFESNSWYGILVPAATPKDVVARLSQALIEIIKTPEVATALRGQGLEPVGTSADEFAQFIRTEMTKYAEAVRVSGARID